jgi:hypothetical protein
MNHRVQKGECLSSIAARHGHLWKDVWDHPENAPLRDKRKDPNVLHPGDVIFIPEKAQKTEAAATNKRHQFKIHLEKVKIHLRLTGALEPLDKEPYELNLGRSTITGETDGEGKIEAEIPADLTEVTLLLPRRLHSYTLALGHLDPPDTTSGAEARLRNLRLMREERRDPADLEAAVAAFQRVKKLEVTGALDARTASALLDEHGC